jgi:hypothetical protein
VYDGNGLTKPGSPRIRTALRPAPSGSQSNAAFEWFMRIAWGALFGWTFLGAAFGAIEERSAMRQWGRAFSAYCPGMDRGHAARPTLSVTRRSNATKRRMTPLTSIMANSNLDHE